MININSALIEQAVSLLAEHNIRCNVAEAPSCASLSFFGMSRHEDEELAVKLLNDHFGPSMLLGISGIDKA